MRAHRRPSNPIKVARALHQMDGASSLGTCSATYARQTASRVAMTMGRQKETDQPNGGETVEHRERHQEVPFR